MKLDERIMEVIEAVPGITSSEINTLLTDTKISSVTARLVTLFAEGKVVREAHGRAYHYTVAPAGTKPPIKQTAMQAPTDAAISHRITQIERERDELFKWKANAIARFPELSVPEAVLRARAIVCEALGNESKAIDEVKSGKRDHTVAIRAVMAALEMTQ